MYRAYMIICYINPLKFRTTYSFDPSDLPPKYSLGGSISFTPCLKATTSLVFVTRHTASYFIQFIYYYDTMLACTNWICRVATEWRAAEIILRNWSRDIFYLPTLDFFKVLSPRRLNKKNIQPNLCNIFSVLICNKLYLFVQWLLIVEN